MSDKRFVRRKFSCVVDHRVSPQLLTNLDNKSKQPFGQLIYYPPKEIERDYATGEIIPEAPRPVSKVIQKLMERPDFQMNDELHVELVCYEHQDQPSYISIQCIIPAAECPSTISPKIVGKELIVGFVIPAGCISELGDECLPEQLYATSEDGSETLARRKLLIPEIVKKSGGKKFREMKSDFNVMRLTIDNSLKGAYGTAPRCKQMKLLHNHTFEGRAKRAVDAMQAMVKSTVPFTIDIYVKNDDKNMFRNTIGSLFGRLKHDQQSPSIWQQMHTKKLGVGENTVYMDIGSLKNFETRPQTETNAVDGYFNRMEMCTRQALISVESKEDEERNATDLNVQGGIIRLISQAGAGDAAYIGVLYLTKTAQEEAVRYKLRFKKGDILNVNFSVDAHKITKKHDFTFKILDPLIWTLQGEIVGQLRRPHVQLLPDASEEQKRAGREWLPTRLPVTDVKAMTSADIRSAVDNAQPLKVTLSYSISYKSELRIVASMDTLLNGTRIKKEKTSILAPDRIPATTALDHANFLLMQNAQSTATDIIPDVISKQYLEAEFQDEDQVRIIQYLYACPTTFNNLKWAAIHGFPGSGKTYMMAGVIVALLLGDPRTSIAVAAPSNEAVDVFVLKINEALEAARKKDSRYESILRGVYALRVFNEKTETQHVLTKSDRVRLDKLAEVHEERMLQSILDDFNYARSADPEYDPYCDSDYDPVLLEKLAAFEANRPIQPSDGEDNGKQKETSSFPKRLDSGIAEISSSAQKDGSDSKVAIPTSDHESEGDDDDDDEEKVDNVIEGDDISDLADGSVSRGKKKKKSESSKAEKKHVVFGQKRADFEKSRNDVNSHYFVNDERNAIALSAEDYTGAGHNMLFYSQLNRGVVDMGSANIPEDQRNALASWQMTSEVNRQLLPAEHGVRDDRYKKFHLGMAERALSYAQENPSHPVFAELNTKLQEYELIGNDMDKEARKGLNNAIAAAFEETKRCAAIKGMTCSNFGHKGNQLSSVNYLFVEEAGLMTVAEIGVVLANCDTTKVIIIGDNAQLQPYAKHRTPPGYTREGTMSILQLLMNNLWPTAALDMQRRSAPGVMRIPSIMSYQGQIRDAPSTFLPDFMEKPNKFTKWWNENFPEFSCKEHYRYILIKSHGEIQDELTGSWINIDTAAVTINLQTKMIKDGLFDASEIQTISPYTAQLLVHKYAISQAALTNPELRLEDVDQKTVETAQGSSAICTFSDSVRTKSPGFTNNSGRNVVQKTRGRVFVEIADTFNLKLGNDKKIPYLVRSFDEAKELDACIYIDPQGPYAWLLKHPHVHARVVGTEQNRENIQAQELTIDPSEEQSFPDNPIESGGRWGSNNDNSSQGGKWGDNDQGSQQISSGKIDQKSADWGDVEANGGFERHYTEDPRTQNNGEASGSQL